MSEAGGKVSASEPAGDQPTPEMAVLLTFLFGPGMGHFYAGEVRRGASFVGALALAGPGLFWIDVRMRLVPLVHMLGFFVLLTLVVWVASAVDVGRGRARFVASAPAARGLRVAVAGVLIVIASVVAAGLLRGFTAEAFKVPSGSMFPTLLLGDHFFADKRTRELGVGDVAVFTLPAQPRADFVKRVVARGRDVISVDAEGLPTVNGVAARRCRLGRAPGAEGGHPLDYFLETLGGRSYLVVRDPDARGTSSFDRFEVPADSVFVLGDNRDNSYDSRMWDGGRGGTVPVDLVKGLAFGIWWSPATSTFTARDRALDQPMLPPFAASLQATLDACPR